MRMNIFEIMANTPLPWESDMGDRPLVSLCIPTNGITEWVIPVLNSIYNETNGGSVDASRFEVVITDNGDNQTFKKEIQQYQEKHGNLKYQETTAAGFLNETESYKLASGVLIKFINHRTCLLPGTLPYWLRFAEKYEDVKEKPIVYFSTGALKRETPVRRYSSFDEFVRGLSYFSSWSTGVTFWKEDFDRLLPGMEYNALFPHTTLLFSQTKRKEYIIDDTPLLYEIPADHSRKGRYDLFFAFAVEYMGILLDLHRAHAITAETFLYVKKKNLYFLAECIISFKIRKQPCSYDLSNMWGSLHVFYSTGAVWGAIGKVLCKKLVSRILCC